MTDIIAAIWDAGEGLLRGAVGSADRRAVPGAVPDDEGGSDARG